MIEVKDIQVKYGDFIAIDDVSFQIEEGHFFTLLGPSGCGKTTLLRAIAGFNQISKGSILVDGKDISKVPVEKRGLGMVFQSYALFPTMTVYDNIAYGLEVEGKSKSDIQQRVHEVSEMVELNQKQLNKNVSALSGGQQQRVAIARALAKKPSIVLFDEPLSNLDAKLRKQLRKELKDIQYNTGMTAIYVTHDQEEALELSDNIAVFSNGRIEQIGTPTEIYNYSETEFVCNFIGNANYLTPKIVTYLSQQVNGEQIQVHRRNYIREEKVFLQPQPDPGFIELPVIVKKVSFRGILTAVDCHFEGDLITVVVQGDYTNYLDIDEKLTLYIHPQDILSYEED